MHFETNTKRCIEMRVEGLEILLFADGVDLVGIRHVVLNVFHMVAWGLTLQAESFNVAVPDGKHRWVGEVKHF